MNIDIEEMKRQEAKFFDQSAKNRTSHGQIPLEADIRRATRFIPSSPDQESIDPKMSQILEGYFRDSFIEFASLKKGGNVLDIGCGPGWLSLELGRREQIVNSYDLSPEALKLANKMLEENPYKQGFGQVTYHLKDVREEKLIRESYDAIVGWSSIHHLPELEKFMDQVYHALKPGAIFATEDDMPRSRIEIWLERIFCLLLPTYDRTYGEKIRDTYLKIIGKKQKKQHDYFTPMEEFAAKDDAVFQLSDILYNKFEVVWNVRFNGFVHAPAMYIKGPDWFRYSTVRILVFLDRLLCKLGIIKGFIRIMIAKKR